MPVKVAALWFILENCLFLLLIYYIGRFKIWEVLLFTAVALLAALLYETHNDRGRYINIDGLGPRILDTRTGRGWTIHYKAIPKGF